MMAEELSEAPLIPRGYTFAKELGTGAYGKVRVIASALRLTHAGVALQGRCRQDGRSEGGHQPEGSPADAQGG